MHGLIRNFLLPLIVVGAISPSALLVQSNFLGLHDGRAVLYLNASGPHAQRETFSYWWIYANMTKSNIFGTKVTSQSGYHLIDLKYGESGATFCYGSGSKNNCQPLTESLHISTPSEVRIQSTNVNHVTSWEYGTETLGLETYFIIEMLDELIDGSAWEHVPECHMIRGRKCNLFRQIHDTVYDNECPDYTNGGKISVRIKACLVESLCSAWTNSETPLILPEDDVLRPDFEVLGVFSSTQLRILNFPVIVTGSNKSLSCYYENLGYQIRYWGENDTTQAEREDKATFDRTAISLKLFEEPKHNTLMCVSMCFEDKIDSARRFGEWRTKCKVVNPSKEGNAPTYERNDGDVRFKVILSFTLAVVAAILVILFFKTKRLYRSISKKDEEIPKELLDVIMDFERCDPPSHLNRHTNESTDRIDPIHSDWTTKRTLSIDSDTDSEVSTAVQESLGDMGCNIHMDSDDAQSYVAYTRCGSVYTSAGGSTSPNNIAAMCLENCSGLTETHCLGDKGQVRAVGSRRHSMTPPASIEELRSLIWERRGVELGGTPLAKANPTYYTNIAIDQFEESHFNKTLAWNRKACSSASMRRLLAEPASFAHYNENIMETKSQTYSNDTICSAQDLNGDCLFSVPENNSRGVTESSTARPNMVQVCKPEISANLNTNRRQRATDQTGINDQTQVIEQHECRVCQRVPQVPATHMGCNRQDEVQNRRRRRTESFKSVDSGFPTSDESVSPPLSPRDYTAQITDAASSSPNGAFMKNVFVVDTHVTCSSCQRACAATNVCDGVDTVETRVLEPIARPPQSEWLDSSYLKLTALNKMANSSITE
ncbi:uncharacterized protein LOC113474790 [Ciona intestinalis]